MNIKPNSLLAIILSTLLFAAQVRAGVGDPTLRTDHSDYPGEGAFQTVEDCVEFATSGKTDPQDRAIALYHWLLTHQFHLYSPQEWNVPNKVPGAKTDDYEMVVYDANRGRFSYGYGLCGTVHAWNEPYWRALGMTARRRAFPGHVNSEVQYGGAWHAFDTDMAGLVFRPDGVVAGYDDVARDPSIVRLNNRGIVCYPFAWPSDFETMKQGWQQVAEGGNWYRMYNSGYAAMPGVVNLRSGETFTRHFDRDIFGGPTKRRFWHVQKDGPWRNWTFVNMGPPSHNGEQSNCRGNASYANAVFKYEPDFTRDAWMEGVVERSKNLALSSSRQLVSADDKPAWVAFQHFSPYVICGDPIDDTNPMSGRATDGLVVTGEAQSGVTVEISVDQGQSWQSCGQADQSFRLDLTEQAKGRYGWWIKFTCPPNAKLSRVAFETTCQVNQAMYPRLSPNGCRVTYQTRGKAVTVVKPNFGLAEDLATRCEVLELRSANLKYSPRSADQITAYSTTNNKPAVVAFQIESPQALLEVSAAARYRVRSPQPEGCDFHLDLSTDGGQTWSRLGQAVNAPDNEYSSGWVYGHLPVQTANCTAALLKVHLDAGGYGTGLIDFEAYGLSQTPPPQAVEVTWAWRTPKSPEVFTHRQDIAANATEHTWDVPTPTELTDAWVQIQAR